MYQYYLGMQIPLELYFALLNQTKLYWGQALYAFLIHIFSIYSLKLPIELVSIFVEQDFTKRTLSFREFSSYEEALKINNKLIINNYNKGKFFTGKL